MLKIRRLVVLLAGVTGLLAVYASAAQAHVVANHSEPIRRRSSRPTRVAVALAGGLLAAAGIASAGLASATSTSHDFPLVAVGQPHAGTAGTDAWTEGNGQPTDG